MHYWESLHSDNSYKLVRSTAERMEALINVEGWYIRFNCILFLFLLLRLLELLLEFCLDTLL